MPSGRTHDRITLWTLPAVASLSFTVTQHSHATLFVCAGFLFGGLMLGPDLDTHSIHYKRWGWLRWIWLPYRGSIRHRSPWSHSPIMGTTVRIVYLLAWCSLFSLLGIAAVNEVWQLGWSWEDIGRFWGHRFYQYKFEAIALCIGLEMGAFSHYTADWIVSTCKRVKTKGIKAILPHSGKTRRRKPPRRKVKR